MCLAAFAATFLGGSTRAYPYRSVSDIAVPRRGEGVGSGDGMPVREKDDGGSGGSQCPSTWSGFCGGEL